MDTTAQRLGQRHAQFRCSRRSAVHSGPKTYLLRVSVPTYTNRYIIKGCGLLLQRRAAVYGGQRHTCKGIVPNELEVAREVEGFDGPALGEAPRRNARQPVRQHQLRDPEAALERVLAYAACVQANC